MDEDGEGVAWTTKTWSSVGGLNEMGEHGQRKARRACGRQGVEQSGVEQSGVDDEA